MSLSRRHFMLGITALASAPMWPSMQRALASSVASGGWSGYAGAIVIDALGGPGEYNAAPLTPLSKKAIDDVRASGLTAVNVTVSGVGSYAKDADQTIRNIAYWNAQIAAQPDRLMQVRNASDLAAAKRTGKLGLIYGFQDATPMGENLDRVALYDDLGVRVFQLTYNRRNLIGDGCLEPGNDGLR